MGCKCCCKKTIIKGIRSLGLDETQRRFRLEREEWYDLDDNFIDCDDCVLLFEKDGVYYFQHEESGENYLWRIETERRC